EGPDHEHGERNVEVHPPLPLSFYDHCVPGGSDRRSSPGPPHRYACRRAHVPISCSGVATRDTLCAFQPSQVAELDPDDAEEDGEHEERDRGAIARAPSGDAD